MSDPYIIPHFSPFCSSSPGKDSKPRPCEGITLIAAPQDGKDRNTYVQIAWSTTLPQRVLEAPWRQVELNIGGLLYKLPHPTMPVSRLQNTFAVNQLWRSDVLVVQVTTTYQKRRRFGRVTYLQDVCHYSMALPSVVTGMSTA